MTMVNPLYLKSTLTDGTDKPRPYGLITTKKDRDNNLDRQRRRRFSAQGFAAMLRGQAKLKAKSK